jgi:hypothetical protein
MKNPNTKVHAFLTAIRAFPHVSRAAKAAGIARTTHYRRYDKDKEYAKAFDAAWRYGVGVLRDEAIRRVLLGYEEPVIYKGAYQYDEKGRMVTVTKYPERLTMAVLRGELPDTYNRNRVQISGPSAGPIKTEESITIRFVDAPVEEQVEHPDDAPATPAPDDDDPDSDPSASDD